MSFSVFKEWFKTKMEKNSIENIEEIERIENCDNTQKENKKKDSNIEGNWEILHQVKQQESEKENKMEDSRIEGNWSVIVQPVNEENEEINFEVIESYRFEVHNVTNSKIENSDIQLESDEDSDDEEDFFIPRYKIKCTKGKIDIFLLNPVDEIKSRKLEVKKTSDGKLYYKCEIKGEVKKPEKKQYLDIQREFGKFKITFRVPYDLLGDSSNLEIRPVEYNN